MPVEQQTEAEEAVILDGGGTTASAHIEKLVPVARFQDAYAFHLVCSMAELLLDERGRLIPDLPAIPHAEGVNGAFGTGNPGRALDIARKKGRKVIPHSFPCKAWDKDRAGYLSRSLAGTDRNGEEVHCYHDCWHKPVFVGSRFIRWDFDDKGWADFRQRVLAWMLEQDGIDSVPDIFQDMARKKIETELASLSKNSPLYEERKAALQQRLNPPKPTSKRKRPAKG